MSADSPRRSGSRVTRQGGGSVCGNGGQVIVPQPVTDPSIIESVTGFINDVVPQAYTSTLPGDSKETITWARFESTDINDPALFPDNSSDTVLPLILILGYNTGVQVWAIPANGEATEVLSWSQGSVRTLRILPSPTAVSTRSSDHYSTKRPLVAICDCAGPGPPFCSVSFISLKTGDQVKSIKFKNPICDVYANRRSVIVTFPERIAVFDACSLEDRLSITSCFPSPGPNANPVALGSRWLAFAEKKLVAWQRSSGGVGGGTAQSYTATVLHAAQTLGRGLRGLSETVASSLTGPRNHTGGQLGILGSSPPAMNGTDHNSPGIVTVLDLEAASNQYNGADEGHSGNTAAAEGVIAHFIAHSEAIVALEFDPSGTLLLTADKRGHDFHVFRLQPHPSGSSLAAVHHLYVLHRGDTTAKVQSVAFACDSRWVAVSTMRGTTHVFPLTPYGGPVGFRTHGSPLVVNRLSRFHRSAGLSADGRSSPVPSPESPPCLPSGPHANPRLPPYPHPASQSPLAQLRQSPHPPLAPAGPLDVSLRVCATFASPRAWLLDSQTAHPRDGPRDSSKVPRRPVDSLFVMSCHGNLIQYDLDPKPVTMGPREKICDDTQIELDVEAKAQWPLQRSPHSIEVLPPLSSPNPLLCGADLPTLHMDSENNGHLEERWLSQVEIVTHAGPHRRLWMGPQITFKTYTTSNAGSNVSLQDVEAIEVGTVPVSRPARSNPVNMPPGGRPLVPVLIESGSGSSFEQSPHLLEVYGADSGEADHWGGHGDSRLREDLADAMLESPGAPSREKGKRRYFGLVGGGGGGGGGGDGVGEGRVMRGGGTGPVRRVVNPGGAEITMLSDGEESDIEQHDLPEHHWEAIAFPATAPSIPVPPAPDSDSSPREMVTTIAAARLQTPSKLNIPSEKIAVRDQGLNLPSLANDPAKNSVKLSHQTNANSVSGASKKEALDRVGSAGVTSDMDAEGGGLVKTEGSIESENPVSTELVKCKTEKGSGNVEYPLNRKKGRKTSVIKDEEVLSKGEVDSIGGSSDNAEDLKSFDVSLNKKAKEVVKIAESTQPVTEKKGKKVENMSINNQIPLKVGSRKSPSPQKEVEMKSAKKSALVIDKSTSEDLVSVSQKKSKKKIPLSKDNSKEDEGYVEPITSEKVNEKPTLLKGDVEAKQTLKEHKNNPISDKVLDCITIDSEVVNMEDASCKIPDFNAKVKVDFDSELILKSKDCCEIQDGVSDAVDTDLPKGKKLHDLEVVDLDSYKKLSKGCQNEVDQSVICVSGNSPTERIDCSTVTKKMRKNGKVEKQEKSISEEHLNGTSVGEKNVNVSKTERNGLDQELGTVAKRFESNISKDAENVSHINASNSCLNENDSENNLGSVTVEVGSDSRSGLSPEADALDSPGITSSKSKKKGSKVAKAWSNVDSKGTKVKNDASGALTPLESIPSDVWSTTYSSETAKESENFPPLTSKSSKKNWSLPSDETHSTLSVDGKDKATTHMTKKSDKNDGDFEVMSSCLVDHDTSKAKKGWELPINSNHQNVKSEMDIDKLTFEDLEAIVDAACKEGVGKIDNLCSKENKKGKKSEANTSTQTSKEAENINDGVSCPDLGKVISAPKPADEASEEQVKSPEKPVATSNKSSKAQRRKRRRVPITRKLF